jgi:hypothetical protein
LYHNETIWYNEKVKHRIDKFLLGTLWTCALLLAASFWFDTRFGFNIFLRAHWRYLANIQTGAEPVAKLFYISLVIFTMILPLGLYLITRPYRKIKMKSEKLKVENLKESNNSTLQTAQPAMPAATVARPPQLIVPVNIQNSPRNVDVDAADLKTSGTATLPHYAIERQINPETVSAIREILGRAGWTVKNAPTIGGLLPSAWAIGADERLIVGIICPEPGEITADEGDASIWKSDSGDEFASPVSQLASAMEKLRTLFLETLDEDIKISIRGFVVMDSGIIINRDKVQMVWDAFDIRVFDSVTAFKEFIGEHSNRALPPEEKEDFDAYAEYIDTVGEYFNGKK